MSRKILVTVRQPASGVRCDVMIPYDVRMDRIARSLAAVIEQLSQGEYVANSMPMVYNMQKGSMVDMALTAYENGIRSGDQLLQV